MFSVKNGVIFGGVLAAIGYLFLIGWTVVNQEKKSDQESTTIFSVSGCILSLAVMGAYGWLDRNARLITVGVIGFVLLLLNLSAVPEMGLFGAATIMIGSNNLVIGLGFALAVSSPA